MGLVKRFLLRKIPAYVEGGLNIVDVRDIAEGHLLADAKGVTGERYILSGRNFTLDRLFADLARISGVEPPSVKVPGPILAGMMAAGSRARLPMPTSADEVRSGMLWWHYRNTKAKQELGFKPRPHEETLEAAVAWQAAQLGDRVAHAGSAERLAMGALGKVMRMGERVTGR